MGCPCMASICTVFKYANGPVCLMLSQLKGGGGSTSMTASRNWAHLYPNPVTREFLTVYYMCICPCDAIKLDQIMLMLML